MNPDELKTIEVLRALDPEALIRLAGVLEERTCREGEPVFAEGDPGDSMYFIVQGQVRIEKRVGASDARAKVLTVLKEGDYFGEMALLDQKPRSASAIPGEAARLLRLSKNAFDQLQQSPGAAGTRVLFAMVRTSSDRIRRLSAQLVVYDEVGKAIGESRNLQELLEIILRQLAAVAGADWGFVALRSEFSEQLEVRGRIGVDLSPAQVAAIRNGEGFLDFALRNGGELRADDSQAHEGLAASARLGFETPSLLVSPLTLGGKFLGLVVLGGRQRGQFDLDAANLVRGVARQTAQAIVNARHREEEEARSRHSRQFVRF